MGHKDRYDDDQDEDEVIDPEDPDESDMDEDDDPGLIPCPYCGKSISEEAEFCHLCGKYISEEDRPGGVPWWIMAGTVLGLLVVATWVVMYCRSC